VKEFTSFEGDTCIPRKVQPKGVNRPNLPHAARGSLPSSPKTTSGGKTWPIVNPTRTYTGQIRPVSNSARPTKMNCVTTRATNNQIVTTYALLVKPRITKSSPKDDPGPAQQEGRARHVISLGCVGGLCREVGTPTGPGSFPGPGRGWGVAENGLGAS